MSDFNTGELRLFLISFQQSVLVSFNLDHDLSLIIFVFAPKPNQTLTIVVSD